MLKIPQATWIATFLEGVIEKSTGLPLFSELVWFAYKVSGVMCSASAFEHCCCIEGWIHSQRRNRFHQKLVEKLVRSHTNLVLRERLMEQLERRMEVMSGEFNSQTIANTLWAFATMGTKPGSG